MRQRFKSAKQPPFTRLCGTCPSDAPSLVFGDIYAGRFHMKWPQLEEILRGCSVCLAPQLGCCAVTPSASPRPSLINPPFLPDPSCQPSFNHLLIISNKHTCNNPALVLFFKGPCQRNQFNLYLTLSSCVHTLRLVWKLLMGIGQLFNGGSAWIRVCSCLNRTTAALQCQ